jgi:hypothetical protein
MPQRVAFIPALHLYSTPEESMPPFNGHSCVVSSAIRYLSELYRNSQYTSIARQLALDV